MFGIEAGRLAYELEIGLWLVLFGLMLCRGRYRAYPYFFAYAACSLLRKLVLFPLLYAHGINAYSSAYWLSAPLMVFFLLLTLAEFYGHPLVIASTAGVLALTEGVCYYLAGVYSWRWEPTRYIELAAVIAVTIGAGWIIRKDLHNPLAVGMFIACFVLTLLKVRPMMFGTWQRYISSYSYLVSLILWSGWANSLHRQRAFSPYL